MSVVTKARASKDGGAIFAFVETHAAVAVIVLKDKKFQQMPAPLSVSAILLLSFALELYLKSLIELEGSTPPISTTAIAQLRLNQAESSFFVPAITKTLRSAIQRSSKGSKNFRPKQSLMVRSLHSMNLAGHRSMHCKIPRRAHVSLFTTFTTSWSWPART
jgi:hypothetical protein